MIINMNEEQKRFELAKAAMQGIFANSNSEVINAYFSNVQKLARFAFYVAHQMLAEEAKPEKTS